MGSPRKSAFDHPGDSRPFKQITDKIGESSEMREAQTARSNDVLQWKEQDQKRTSEKNTDTELAKILDEIRIRREKRRAIETSGSISVEAKGLRQETGEGYIHEIERADSGDKIAIHYISPESQKLFRDFSVASIYDFHQRSQDLKTHIDNNDIHAVYVSLYQLQQEKGAVDALNSAFKGATGSSIEQALASRWSGPALEYSRQLIGTGEKTSELAIGHVPSRSEEFSGIAKRVHQILNDKKGLAPEKLFAALTPLRRNTALIWEVDNSYGEEFRRELVDDIRAKLGTDKAADFGRFLLGEQKLEQKVISPKEAERLSAAFAHQSFEAEEVVKEPANLKAGKWPPGTVFAKGRFSEKVAQWRAQVPYGCAEEGCYARASIMSFSMKEMGFGSEKAVIVGAKSDKGGILAIQSDYAADSDINDKPPSHDYFYHIAPMIEVQADAESRSHIFDSSPEPGKARLWSVDGWQKQLYKGPVENKSFAELTEMLETEERNHPDKEISYPFDRAFFFPLNRDYTQPPLISRDILGEPSAPDIHANNAYRNDKRTLTSFIHLSIDYSIAAAIRREHASGAFNPERFSREMSNFQESFRVNFPQSFPKLFESFTRTLNPDQQRQFREHFVPANN